MNWPFGHLGMFRYGGILADPPWPYEMRSPLGYEKSPEAHYDTMAVADIAALPVDQLAARDCLLWLWTPWPHLPMALGVMASWGFTYKTGGAWVKRTRTGKAAFGTGYILRTATEPFLIGTIGDPEYGSRAVRNLIEGLRREHSRKPPEARQMMSRLLPRAFMCELFAREPWPGHDVWGKEAAKFSAVAEAGVGDSLAHGGAVGLALGGRGRPVAQNDTLQRSAEDPLLEAGRPQLLLFDALAELDHVQTDFGAVASSDNRHGVSHDQIIGRFGSGRAGEQGEDGEELLHGSIPSGVGT